MVLLMIGKELTVIWKKWLTLHLYLKDHIQSVDMAMYMNRGGSAAHMMDRRISMEAVTEKAERCLPEEIIDAALKLLRSDLEIRQQFMSFRNDDAARRNIMYELSKR